MYTLLLIIAAATLCLAEDQATCPNSVVPGSFSYKVGSTSTTGYIIQAGGSNSWGPVSASGSSVTIGKGPRFYLASGCVSAFGATAFSTFGSLVGGSITFTVDVSQLGCGTNAAFYLVNMPATGAGSNGDYYCDANCVGGACCAEMDLLEANRWAVQITPHKCSSATGGCDAGGCARNTQTAIGKTAYGPGTSYTINSNSPYTVKIAFAGSGSALTGITTTFTQGSKSISFSHSDSNCGSGYLNSFGGVLKTGMVPVWSYWTGNMAWLDSPACSNENNEVAGNFIFSNLIVSGTVGKTTGPPTTPPPPPPPPGTVVCGTSGTTTNQWWIEFKPPSGVDGSKTTAVVTCGSGSCQACTWFASGAKYQCSCPGNGCTNPSVTVGGKACALSASALTEDSMANSSSNDQPMIIGVSVVAALLVITIIVVVVVYLKKRGSTEIA